jgi:predicted ATPase
VLPPLEGTFFLTGRFDQLQQMVPFLALSAFASAFNEYFNRMAKEGQESHLQLVATRLRAALGKDARHLVKVIPNLGVISLLVRP